MGNTAEALELYTSIHQSYPDNVECLRYLIVLSRDFGRRTEALEEKLAKLERVAAAAAKAEERATASSHREGEMNEDEDEEASRWSPSEAGDVGGGYQFPTQGLQQQEIAPSKATASKKQQQQQQRPKPDGGGFGTQEDRFAAPSMVTKTRGEGGRGGGGKEAEFEDADLSSLLKE